MGMGIKAGARIQAAGRKPYVLRIARGKKKAAQTVQTAIKTNQSSSVQQITISPSAQTRKFIEQQSVSSPKATSLTLKDLLAKLPRRPMHGSYTLSDNLAGTGGKVDWKG